MGKFENKVCLVTGGGSGIGEAIVKKMASEGGFVYVLDLNEENGSNVANSIDTGAFMKLDVTNLDNWKSVTAKIMEEKGKIDVLVNCAGLANTGTPMQQMDLQRDWELLININLNGPFYGIYTVVPYMMEKGGAIVNISSVASLVAQCGVTGYTAAKGAVNSLTRACAVDYAQYNIRCNAVCPTTTATPALKRLFDNMPEIEAALEKDNVLPRFGKPEDIANAVAFLASDEASYVNGQILPVDGGFTAK